MALYTTQILIDDSVTAAGGEPGYTFNDGWDHSGGYSVATPNDTMKDQSFKVSFSGIHIVTFGGGPGEFDWSLDDGPSNHAKPIATGMRDSRFPLFNSTILDDKNHTLSVGNFTGNITVDHSLVRPGSSTPVDSSTLIQVDDIDSGVVYAGHWDATQDPSRHTSANKGDSIAFGFCGTYTTISGTFDNRLTGNLTLGFSVDKRSPEVRTFSSLIQASTNYLYFYNTQLTNSEESGCQHSLNVTILDITGGQSFSFASFYYRPSFTVFGDAPSITVLPSGSSSTSGPSPTGGDKGGYSDGTHKKSSIVGPVVGGVIGGLVVIAGIIVAIWLLRRKKRAATPPSQMQQYHKDEPHNPNNPTAATPFILPEIQQADYSPYNDYNPPTVGNNAVFTPVRRTELSSTTYNEKGGNHLTYVPPVPSSRGSNMGSSARPLSISDASSMAPSSSPPNTHDRDENGNVTRQMMEMMQAISQRVDALHRPPAYDAPPP